MKVEETAVIITALGLFFAPIVIFPLFFSLRRWRPSSLRPATIVAVSMFAFVLVAAAAGFSFKSILLNFVCLIVTYAAYCFLAIGLWRISFWPLRIIALLAAWSRLVSDMSHARSAFLD